MLLSFETLKSIIGTGEPILVELIDLVISNDLRWLTFLPGSLTITLTFLLFWISSAASICSTMALTPLFKSDHVVVSFYIDFPTNSKGDAPFHCIAYDYSRAD